MEEEGCWGTQGFFAFHIFLIKVVSYKHVQLTSRCGDCFGAGVFRAPAPSVGAGRVLVEEAGAPRGTL